jgi:hypothetical protein
VCHLGETYSKAYEFFYEDMTPHKLPVLEVSMASASQSRFPSRRDWSLEARVRDSELCEQHVQVYRLK